MGNRNRYDTGYHPQMTDAQLESFRGLLDRGLRKEVRPPETVSSMYDDKTGQIFGCSDQNTLNDLANSIDALKQLPPNGDVPNRPTIVFDRHTLRRLIIVGGTVATFHNRTPCLLRLAALMDKSLSRHMYNNFRKEFFELLEVLIGIGDEIILRTKRPYKFFADAEANPKLDPKVLQIEPLANYHYWKTLLDVRSAKAVISNPSDQEEVRFSVEDKDGWQQTLDEIERNLEARRVDVEIAAAGVGDMPTVNAHLENLRKLKLTDIERQTRARFPPHWHAYKLIEHVELIIYHSIYAVILDKNGNPFRRKGFATYSLLLPEPGENLLRHFHPPGLYLSLGPLGDYQFEVSGLKVKNLLFAGITSLTRTQSTFTFEHPLQEQINAYIRNQGIHGIAAITVPEAFKSPDLSISAIRRTMPILIDETVRYAVIELMKRLKRLFENYEQIIKDVGKQVIKEVIEDKVKDWCREWLIKKIGKKFIPGINVVSAFADVLDDEQTEMIRAMISCVVMATKSTRRDDLTITSKILAQIAMDKVQEAVIAELTKRAGKMVSKSDKSGDKDQDAADDPKPHPSDAPATDKPPHDADAGKSARPASTPDKPADTTQVQSKPLTQQQIAEQMRLAQQIQHAQQQSQQQQQSQEQPKPEAQSQAQQDQQKAQQQRQRPQHQQLQQQQTKRPTPEPDPGDTATQAKAVEDKGTGASTEKPGTARERQPDASRRDDAPDAKATDTKATDSKVARDDEAGARSTQLKSKDDRGTKPPTPAPPKEPPLPPSNTPWRDRWKFYVKHRDDYPPHIQQMLDKTRKRTKDQQEQVEAAIREHYAHQLSQHWGIPVKTTSRIPMTQAEKPPLPPKNMSWQKRWEFYDKHRDDYPPHIQDMMDRMQNRNEEQSKQVELAIREHHASRPMQDTSGGDWEKTNIAERTGERPKLSTTSTTKDGTVVQIDDFDPARRVAKEYKASLEIAGKDPQVAQRELQERMERHAQFAEDRGLAAYEWVAHSKDSYVKMTNALSDLKEKAGKITNEETRKKLLERYKKISIVDEPILDE